MEKVLIVEDDLQIQTLIRDYVNASGYIAVTASDGEEALMKYESEQPQLALLDIILPKIDGFELCRKIRSESNIPIIMISSKKEDTDKILALGLGADDYIEKPFSPRVLIAKIQSQFRRVNVLSGTPHSDTLTIKELEIDVKARTVSVKGEQVAFSVKEFEILHYLMLNKNQALSREKIFDEIWGYNEFGDINTVTVHMRKIREKIELDPSNPEYIETVWGIGYKFKG
ncbi:response regulator transcription factor [Fusibacter bizertensis]|jgi:Response regulators consisting of a CheY-like receiver domain and a winged-helix DNA-binding domain|uniref:Stage 0 sporulation protein A homolog n=1 Tax=Fusibacter bizertensis TaxID=1488331 RepID=A0ABT6NDL9_9FIRM|nr:response regulator transcription factor [Fusibacter bizertensis]MDH8678529.1 response regulator transcription factor [Fusibacter bizertensis]